MQLSVIDNSQVHSTAWKTAQKNHELILIYPTTPALISSSRHCLFPFPYTMLFLSALSQPAHVHSSPGAAKKRSYVPWCQELISNFLYNSCIISSDSGNLAHVAECAVGRRSAWQLSSAEMAHRRQEERLNTVALDMPRPLENFRCVHFQRNKFLTGYVKTNTSVTNTKCW